MALVLALGPLSGCFVTQQKLDEWLDSGWDGGLSGSTADATNGEALYSNSCVGCHGTGGLGEEETGVSGATNLQVYAPSASEAVIVEVILNGTGSMPPIGLTQSEAEDVAAYVVAQFGS